MSRNPPDYWWGHCPFCGKEARMEVGRFQCNRCGLRFSIGPWYSPANVEILDEIPNPLKSWDEEELKRRLGEHFQNITEIGNKGAQNLVYFHAIAYELALRGVDPWTFLEESYIG